MSQNISSNSSRSPDSNPPAPFSSSKEITGSVSFISAAKDSGVRYVFGVPGFPITDLMNAIFDDPDFSDKSGWFANEKIAFEWALGASFTGHRSLVIVKHVGLNILLDPLMTAMTHTIGAGLVIVVGDDPGVSGSQNGQDSRYFGGLTGTAVYDCGNPKDIYEQICRGFGLSEKIKAPVIVRVTADALNQKMMETLAYRHKGDCVCPISSDGVPQSYLSPLYDRSVWNLKMKGKHQRFHLFNDPVLMGEAERYCVSDSVLDNAAGRRKMLRPGYENKFLEGKSSARVSPAAGQIGVIASGWCFSSAFLTFELRKDIVLMKVGYVSPLPIQKIKNFLKEFSRVLVIEESEPVIEDQIRIFGNVYGKRTGHLPFGKIEREDMLFAVENIHQDTVSKDVVLAARPQAGGSGKKEFCRESIYPGFFEMLAEIREKTNLPVTGDIGCSMYGAAPPHSVIDVAVSLGSSIGIASGITAAVQKKTIVVVGDFALSHSGILSLYEALNRDVPLLVYVMKNNVAAMTGGQAAPDSEGCVRLLAGKSEKSKVHFFVWENGKDPKFFEELKKISLEELKRDGLSVIIIDIKD
ncbi:thiamine pyrophosphate-dependent enzyme [Methanolapillus millepedarum]|uniref:Indolepyruvate oxidoreductase subunit IorA n=1 Tax=Methanolapillus millepedarum TaxID=3028296 RepID=A0AA96V244_9EURY|nr:hypothetical protein MsAc7_05850 [Methanosarcinaceae archaeon Ac7]